MTEYKRLGERLVDAGEVEVQDVDRALAAQEEGDSRKVGTLLVRMGSTSEDHVAQELAKQLGHQYVDPTEARVDPVVVWKLRRDFAESRELIPLSAQPNGAILVAMANPLDMDTIRDLEFLFHTNVVPMVAAPSKIYQAIHRHYSIQRQAHKMLEGLDPQFEVPTTSPTGLELDAEAIQKRLKSGGSQPYIDLLNFLLVNAIERRASDIHLEPQMGDMWVRFRIDGMLREVLRLPSWAKKPLITRIKVVSKLEFYAHGKPQDGKVTAHLGARQIDFRIAVIPTQYGDKVVIRLLDPDMLQTDLNSLGWSPHSLGTYYHMVSQPQGLVLCVGPTGSGKSTTLYSSIHRLRSETTSIITVEDPVEYNLEGITQIQVNPKTEMTFATAVRSILRQDPNVIVIGEVRDKETAEAALEAANTGHLVLSTLHTNFAVSTITRLLDLGVPPYLLSSTLSGIVAQRLVRRVCPDCSIPTQPEQEDWTRLSIEPRPMSDAVRRAGPGCPTCRYVGYRGRVGIYEVLPITDTLRRLISDHAGEADLWREARSAGLKPMLDDALDKVNQGLTSLEEIARTVPVDPFRAEPQKPALLRPTPVEPKHFDPTPIEEELVEIVDVEALEEIIEEIPDPQEDPADLPFPTDMVSPIFIPPPVEEPVKAQGDRATILIADDAKEIRSLVGAILEDDYEVILVDNGLDAIQMAQKHTPDLMVLDVMMPGLTGFDVCEKLRSQGWGENVPVLFLSARGERQYVKQGFLVGADDYLAKPFDPEELELRVQALLRRSRR